MALWFLSPLLIISYLGAEAAVFTLQNGCKETVWPGILSGAGRPQLMDGGIEPQPGQTLTIEAPKGWSGRFWGRSGCNFDSSGKGKCVTGDCGGNLKCAGTGGTPPATLAEFTLDSPDDFYDVSLVDGYNIAVSIIPNGGSGLCNSVMCALKHLGRRCPGNLQVRDDAGKVVACNSACNYFKKPEYCCTGAYGNPNTCKPTQYSTIFKASCPTSYSYAFDDPTSTFTCRNANYLIRFC